MVENIITRGWRQLIDKNTRFDKDDTPACLDHIYYNNAELVKYHVNKCYVGHDHNLTGIVINTRKHFRSNEEIISRCWSRVNWQYAKYLVKYSNKFYRVFQLKHPDDIYDFLEVQLKEVMDNVAPERSIKLKPGVARWMTGYISDRIDHRDDLKAMWQRTGDLNYERQGQGS